MDFTLYNLIELTPRSKNHGTSTLPLSISVEIKETAWCYKELFPLMYYRFTTFETRREMGRVHFRKYFWDCFQGWEKIDQ